MARSDELPEFVRDSQLRAEVEGNRTTHIRPTARRTVLNRETWMLEGIIGQGGGGIVLLQRKIEGRDTGALRAVKRIQLQADAMSSIRRFVRELEASAKFSQKRYEDHFVHSYGWYHTMDGIYITMEYCELGDLGKHLRTKGKIPEDEAKDVIRQIITALAMMHIEGFAHRDLKPSNILIFSKPPEGEWWVKLCDLGLSRRSADASGNTTLMGTPQYMAPETIGGRFIGNPATADPAKADMWCVGETLVEALTGRKTFDDETLFRYQRSLESFPVSNLKNSGVTESGIDFIRQLMAANPSDRPEASQALMHPWMPHDLDPFMNYEYNSGFFSNHSESLVDYKTNFALSDQMTQASGQWTITSPMSNFTDIPTQTSGQWTETIAEPFQKSMIELENNTHNFPKKGAVDFTAIAAEEAIKKQQIYEEELEKLVAEMERVEEEHENLFAGEMKRKTAEKKRREDDKSDKLKAELEKDQHNGEDLEKLSELEKKQTTNDKKVQEATQKGVFALSPLPAKVDKDILDNFKQFSAKEKLRLSEKQRNRARESKVVKIGDLKKFSQNFKLHTPIPEDLVPILAKDEQDQQRIVEKALLQAQEFNTMKKEPQNQASTPFRSPFQQRMNHASPTNKSYGATNSTDTREVATPTMQPPSDKTAPKSRTWAQVANLSEPPPKPLSNNESNEAQFGIGHRMPVAPDTELEKLSIGLANLGKNATAGSSNASPSSKRRRKKKRAGTVN